MKKVKEIDDEDEWSIKGFKSFLHSSSRILSGVHQH